MTLSYVLFTICNARFGQKVAYFVLFDLKKIHFEAKIVILI